MAFLETPSFPKCVSFGATGGPGYRTEVIVTNSGQEYRNQTWSQARAIYEVSHAAKLPYQYEPLQAFFRTCKGRTHGFRFQDPFDHHALITEGIMLPLGDSTTVFRLYKRYTNGSLTEDRAIHKPRLADPIEHTTLYKDGVQLTYGAGPTQVVFDESSGRVTFGTAPGAAVLTWAGDFDIPCRFDTDEMRGSVENKTPRGELIMSWNSIPLVEIRVP